MDQGHGTSGVTMALNQDRQLNTAWTATGHCTERCMVQSHGASVVVIVVLSQNRQLLLPCPGERCSGHALPLAGCHEHVPLIGKCLAMARLLDLGHARGQAVEHSLVEAHAVQAMPRHAPAQAVQQRPNAPLARQRAEALVTTHASVT